MPDTTAQLRIIREACAFITSAIFALEDVPPTQTQPNIDSWHTRTGLAGEWRQTAGLLLHVWPQHDGSGYQWSARSADNTEFCWSEGNHTRTRAEALAAASRYAAVHAAIPYAPVPAPTPDPAAEQARIRNLLELAALTSTHAPRLSTRALRAAEDALLPQEEEDQ